MLDQLKQAVWKANLDLVKEGLVIQTWGNASGIDREKGLVVIKPSGLAYSELKPKHMVVVALDSGKVVEGDLNPSSDTATHLVLYRAFESIGGVVHTHSLYATAWAQTCCDVPALGTTHADYFYGAIPCTRLLRPAEIKGEYEAETGNVIVETFTDRDPLSCPAVLVASHGPFAWGKTAHDAVHNAVVLEHVVHLAGETFALSSASKPMQQVLLDKHFFRKHGPGAYYGQGARQTKQTQKSNSVNAKPSRKTKSAL
jgi:L-ribulose-5-phosphate 4-epimerase